jgi:AraC-like DNA-binding protein
MVLEVAPPLPQTCSSSIWLWPGQALFAGPSLDLAPHSGSVWCLAVGVDRPLTVLTPDGSTGYAHSVLIPPRLTHQLVCHGGRLVSAYLEPTADRAESCRRAFSTWVDGIGVRHAAEEQLAFVPGDDRSACRWLDLAAPATERLIDPRILGATARIRAEPAATLSSRELAAEAGLSESRFLHLFRDEVGTSLRRYRLWVRLLAAGAAISSGRNLTTAAVDSGFASPSHLADRFKATFGLSATQLLGTGATLRTP